MASADEHRFHIDKYREYYDQALTRHVGARPPEPFPGQTLTDYRIEALRSFKQSYLPQNHELYGVNFRRTRASFRNDAAGLNAFLSTIEPQLLAACVTEANNPAHVPPGELKQIEVLDETGRLRMTKFIGQECFVKAMGRPGRRVTSFTTDRGRFDASGRPLR
jgi:hypothetical protein